MDSNDPVEQTLTQLLACRRAPMGCTFLVQFDLGKEATARRIRNDHERHLCPFRHVPLPE